MELKPKSHFWYGFSDLIPYWQSSWTLWETASVMGTIIVFGKEALYFLEKAAL